MRLLLARGALIVAAFGAGSFQAVQAQWGAAHSGDPCGGCHLRVCTCVPVEPVVETRYRPEQVVTWQDVRHTAWRHEARYETVPVTRVENVTVDEGRYETVWVPRPVTRQVAWTEYQQRLTTRTAPVEVVQRVPQVTTRLVPEQSVRYVAQPAQTVWSSVPPVVSSYVGHRPTAAEFDHGPADVTMTVQLRRTPLGPPVSDDWLDDRELVPSRRPVGVAPSAGGTRQFVPAPSAAAVWQSRR